MRTKFFSISIILFICVFIFLINGFIHTKISNSAEAKSSTSQTKSFNEDLKIASDYWVHNKLGSAYYRAGDYKKSIEEYQKAIQIIEDIPGEIWKDVAKEEMDRINKESSVFKQIYPRYGLIEALEGAGRYDEAIQNVDWLMQNQKMKGKEEFLKQKLQTMRKNLLNKSTQHL